jgi:hypothetical protein
MGGILDRDTAIVQTREVRELAGPVLRSVIDEAAGAFGRCSQSAKDGDENLGILMPFHHGIEMLDGVERLLDSSCVVACRPPLRSAFEASWAVRYVLEDDTTHRALAYVLGDLKERLRWYEQHDPETPRGAKFIDEMGLDEDSGFPRPDLEETRAARARLEGLFASEQYAEIEAEYQSTKKRLKRSMPPWYALFNGPSNIKGLAKHLGDLDDYIIVYKAWSLTSHAVDLNRQLGETDDGAGAAVSVVRSPLGMPNVYSFACSIGVQMTQKVLEHYRPGELERFGKWFLEEVSPTVEQLGEIEEEIVPATPAS